MGPMILERRGPRKPPEQGRRSSDVLARLGEVWEGFIVCDVSAAHNLLIKLHAFLLELESCFLEL